ncbi:hypothetical protein Zm00014a_011417 [Zea mays]|uniref:Uncharacterized protein n=1 Tax=Zea mays TaxID=4577 RepID=A0A317YJB3_MAIZE|nr:hypothetical protein Zm00014a_011417 [Zea mays]
MAGAAGGQCLNSQGCFVAARAAVCGGLTIFALTSSVASSALPRSSLSLTSMPSSEIAPSHSTGTDESAKSSDSREELSLKDDNHHREVPLSTDSSEQSSWPEPGSNVGDQDPELLVNWPSETDLSVDEPWLGFMSNGNELGDVEGTSPWDGTTDWLLDYQDFGMCSSNSVDDSMFHASNGLNF